MSKKEILEFIAEIEEIANTHQDSQCLLYDTEEECATCEDSVTENGKTCALKGMFEIINKCKEFKNIIKEEQKCHHLVLDECSLTGKNCKGIKECFKRYDEALQNIKEYRICEIGEDDQEDTILSIIKELKEE